MVSLSRKQDSWSLYDKAMKHEVLTEDDLNRIDAIILSRMEEENEKNNG